MPESSKVTKLNIVTQKPVFSWEAPEFVRYEKDKKWLVYVIGIAAVLVLAFALMALWSSVVLVVVAATVFAAVSGAHPKVIASALYTEGVVVDGKVYEYDQFKSFWMSMSPDLVKINLQLSGRFAGQVVMPIQDEDPEQVRLFLSKRLPEEEAKGEDLVDQINRLLRF